MSPLERPRRDPYDDPATEPDMREPYSMCGRQLWSDGLPPAQDGDAWICGDCEQARSFETLDL